jgi:hypothetical protein
VYINNNIKQGKSTKQKLGKDKLAHD